VQEQENSQALTGMVTQANNAYQDISNERDSWDAGGSRYQQKEAQDAYNEKMAKLGRDELDWQLDNVTGSGAYGWMDYASSIVGGGISGFNLGNSISGALDFAGKKPAAELDFSQNYSVDSYLENTLGSLSPSPYDLSNLYSLDNFYGNTQNNSAGSPFQLNSFNGLGGQQFPWDIPWTASN
jgi:hypothetical protein